MAFGRVYRYPLRRVVRAGVSGGVHVRVWVRRRRGCRRRQCGGAARARRGNATAGHAVGPRPEAGVAWSVPRRRAASAARRAGGRRSDHGRNRRRVRRRAPRGRCGGSRAPHGGSIARGAASRPLLYSRRTPAWVCGCPGDVLPVVDASRRRNDPRKTTVGRRAWCGLDVSPAPGGTSAREKTLSCLFGGDPLSRRVWGQRPGQPGWSAAVAESVMRWSVTFGERRERAWT